MIDIYLLEELVAFYENGTLAKTAQVLNVTQPTITRGMQKLEDELGVQLFERHPNKITLTKVGEFAAKQAKEVIEINKSYAKKVNNFATSESKVTFAANAPGPLIVLNALNLPNVISNDNNLINENYVNLLINEQYTCLLLNKPLKDPKIESIYLGSEDLFVHLNEFTNLSSKQSVSFSELTNMSFLVIHNIGIWKDVIQEKIPNAKFLYQNDHNNFNEIRNNSIFPYFTTNLTYLSDEWKKQVLNDRRKVKIKDLEANQKFYACFLKKNENRLLPLIEQIQDEWEKVD